MRREGPLVGERPDAASPSNRGPMILTGPIAGDRPVVFRVSGRTELNGPDLLIQVSWMIELYVNYTSIKDSFVHGTLSNRGINGRNRKSTASLVSQSPVDKTSPLL